MCAIIPREVLEAVMNYRPSREYWELLDAEQRKDLPSVPVESPTERPVQPARPSAEEIEAGEQADQSLRKVGDRIAALFRQRAPKAADCGRGPVTLFSKEAAGCPGAIDNMLRQSRCKRTSCPHCWRLRVYKTLRRACTCLLDAPGPGPGHSPRLGKLHVAETHWLSWEAEDKAIRRRYPECVDENKRSSVGRLRVRRANNAVLIVCERPFRGSRPMSPAEALDLVSAAIETLHTDKHSFRLLGSWMDRQEKEWVVIDRYAHLDLSAVRDELKARGARVRQFKNQDARGLVWRTDSRGAANALVRGCPSLSMSSSTVKQTNLDTSTAPARDAFGFDAEGALREMEAVPWT